MKQITQKLGTGIMQVQNVPIPQTSENIILVKNHFSIISAGTESSTVKAARKNLIGKAKDRPQQLKMVIDSLIDKGIVQTFRAVSKKLDSYSPLGYSCAGEVISVGENIQNIKVGDLVACAGAGFANHAEIVAIPKNLCVKLKSDANLKNAAYNTLGAIAMQGVRQADLRIGENCVVIGLGLLGQLTCQILKASGVKVFGIDLDENIISMSKKNKIAEKVQNRNSSNIIDKIFDF